MSIQSVHLHTNSYGQTVVVEPVVSVLVISVDVLVGCVVVVEAVVGVMVVVVVVVVMVWVVVGVAGKKT